MNAQLNEQKEGVMSNEQENVQIVQRMFAAFGQGNILAGLDTLAVAGNPKRPKGGIMG